MALAAEPADSVLTMSADKTIDAELANSTERIVDHQRAERAVRELLEAIGEDPTTLIMVLPAVS